MKTLEKIADLFEMGIYWLLGITTIVLILASVIGMVTENNLPLIAY